LEPRQCFERRVGPIVLVLVEMRRSLFAGYFHRHDLRFETPVGLRGGKALLRSQGPTVLRLARDLVFLDQVLGVPAGMRARESFVQPVAHPAVRERAIAHAVAPATAWSMFSMPPATATLILLGEISCAAETMACAPEPQTRLTVSAGIHLGSGLHD